jgi:transcription elongation factor Spt5
MKIRGMKMNEITENGMKYYPIATAIGAEKRVLAEVQARLSDFGSLKGLSKEIGERLFATHVRGYVVIQSTAKHHVEKIVGVNKLSGTARMKGVKYVLDEMDEDAVGEWMRERSPLEGLTQGMLVEIVKGAFRGERAVVSNLKESEGTATVQLMDAAIPLSINLSGKEIRCV